MSEWRMAHLHDARFHVVKAAKEVRRLEKENPDPTMENETLKKEALKTLIEAVDELAKWER